MLIGSLSQAGIPSCDCLGKNTPCEATLDGMKVPGKCQVRAPTGECVSVWAIETEKDEEAYKECNSGLRTRSNAIKSYNCMLEKLEPKKLKADGLCAQDLTSPTEDNSGSFEGNNTLIRVNPPTVMPTSQNSSPQPSLTSSPTPSPSP